MTKSCSKCGLIKPLEQFSKDKVQKSGYCCRCKQCAKEYRTKNKKRLLEQKKKYYQDNIERERKKRNEYRETEHGKKVRRAAMKRWEANELTTNPAFKLRKNVRRAVSRALLRSGTSKAGESTFRYLPYSPEQLKEHLEKQFDEHMTWENYGSHWHVDHIFPQSRLPYDNLEHENFKKCWALKNLQPLEAIENIKKGDKICPKK